MRLAAIALAAFGLAGCMSPTTLVTPSGGGYEALRVARTMRLDGVLGGWMELTAGTVLVGDRRRDSDGAQLYCGQALLSDVMTQVPVHTCVTLENSVLVFNAHRSTSGTPNPIPPGAIERIRLG